MIISGRPCDFSGDDEGGAACANRAILLGGIEIGVWRINRGATRGGEGWRNEEGEAVTERVTYRYLCDRFLSRCGWEGRGVVQAHSMRKPQGWTGRVQPVLCLCALCSGMLGLWLIQPRGWSTAGFVDLDQRLCGCLIVGRGDSYCAGDVSRNQRFPQAAWANRAYGDD